MRIKGKYKGNKKVELEDDLNFPVDTELSFNIEEINGPEKKNEKKQEDEEEHPFLLIAKNAIPFGRSDLSEKYHEILYNLDSKDG